MHKLTKGALVTFGLSALAMAAVTIVWGTQPATEIISRQTSPDGKWNISEEYDRRTSCFRVILRDSDGREIAKSDDRFVQSYLIDLPSDHRLELEITNDTAGETGRPIWRLDTAKNQWHIDSSSQPLKIPALPVQ